MEWNYLDGFWLSLIPCYWLFFLIQLSLWTWVSDSDAKPPVNLSICQPLYLSTHSSIPVLFIICLSVTSLPQCPRWFCSSRNPGAPSGPFSYHACRGKPLLGSFQSSHGHCTAMWTGVWFPKSGGGRPQFHPDSFSSYDLELILRSYPIFFNALL